MSIGDKRELILAQLEVVLAAVLGVDDFKRNDMTVAEGTGTVVLMLDGDEIPDSNGFNRGRPANFPNVVALMPEIYVLSDELDPKKAGPALNKMRFRIIHAVLNDPTLKSLAHDGDIRYEGTQTAFAMGRSMVPEMGMNFTVYFVLQPAIAPEESTTE